MATPAIRSRRCGLYLPGHEVHWIQGLRYYDPEHPLIPGRLIDVGDDGIVVVEFDDGIRRYWHHDPRAFAFAAGRNDNHVELQTRWRMLGTPTKHLVGPGVILSYADLAGADLGNTNLTSAQMNNADLAGPNLSNSNLTMANLSHANLTGANLTGATLTSVSWCNATCPDGSNSNDNANTCIGHL